MNGHNQEMECLVFRTNISDKREVEYISESLETISGITEWSVDLEDWERVLRVEGTGIESRQIISILRSLDVEVQEMPI